MHVAISVKTTIVCTIGPNTKPVDRIGALIGAGMSVARLNFSHGDHAYHGEVIDNVRKAMQLKGTTRSCGTLTVTDFFF